MRCLVCNKNLTDYESTRKNSRGEYLDICRSCNKNAMADRAEAFLDTEEENTEENLDDI